jgi:KaiC/GvpD/RAD55 family RecA-like ATPase
VPGLDAVLGGGLPEYSFNLIAGGPGSGKTILAHQLMFAAGTGRRVRRSGDASRCTYDREHRKH